MLELRAALSMARWWWQHGKRQPVRDLLATTFESFTEGVDTPDLAAAAGQLRTWAPASGHGHPHRYAPAADRAGQALAESASNGRAAMRASAACVSFHSSTWPRDAPIQVARQTASLFIPS